TGLGFADDRGFVHVAGQLTQQKETNRAGPYTPFAAPAPNTGNNGDLGEVSFIYGDPIVDAGAVSVNSGFEFSDQVTGYATAMASNRDITSFAFYRASGNTNNIPAIYPEGFVPEIRMLSKDR